jgi:hypothetical protein
MTPVDSLAYVGLPPKVLPEADGVHVSCTFTWDIEASHVLFDVWNRRYPGITLLGGPAIDGGLGPFVPGMYLRPGVVLTSRGCPRACSWCMVPRREGALVELEVTAGYHVQDNNLLACSRGHQREVYEMLRRQSRACVLSGGLDVRLLDDWVIEQLRTLRIGRLFLAADTADMLGPVREARARLGWLSQWQVWCYVLIGFAGETISRARERLEAVYDAGCMPYASLWQPTEGKRLRYDRYWNALSEVYRIPQLAHGAGRRRVGRQVPGLLEAGKVGDAGGEDAVVAVGRVGGAEGDQLALEDEPADGGGADV